MDVTYIIYECETWWFWYGNQTIQILISPIRISNTTQNFSRLVFINFSTCQAADYDSKELIPILFYYINLDFL